VQLSCPWVGARGLTAAHTSLLTHTSRCRGEGQGPGHPSQHAHAALPPLGPTQVLDPPAHRRRPLAGRTECPAVNFSGRGRAARDQQAGWKGSRPLPGPRGGAGAAPTPPVIELRGLWGPYVGAGRCPPSPSPDTHPPPNLPPPPAQPHPARAWSPRRRTLFTVQCNSCSAALTQPQPARLPDQPEPAALAPGPPCQSPHPPAPPPLSSFFIVYTVV